MAATAHYASPNATRTFTQELPTAVAGDVTEKTHFLNTLRSKNAEMQAEINAFLTQKMEEDVQAVEDGKNQGVEKRNKKQEREEEMYGEEDPEDDG